MPRYALATLIISLLATPAFAATETRCGWVDNPTPNNWWLNDAQASWTISEQGGVNGAFSLEESDPVRIAEGTRQDAIVDHMPQFTHTKKYWASRNVGSYGFGCACLTGTFEKSTKLVMTLTHGNVLPLARCYADKRLPKQP